MFDILQFNGTFFEDIWYLSYNISKEWNFFSETNKLIL